MINTRELLEDLDFNGTKAVIKKLIDIVEELETKIKELDEGRDDRLDSLECDVSHNNNQVNELVGDIASLESKIESKKDK